MKKFNLYHYEEDNSHCGSCREPNDLQSWVLFTTLDLEDMEVKFIEYIGTVEETWSFDRFLEYVAENSNDFMSGEMEYPCIFFNQEGTYYSPDIDHRSNFIENEYDISSRIIPQSIFGKERWEKYKKEWVNNFRKRKEAEKKREKELNEKLKQEQKEKAEKEEYKMYKRLKKKWG